MSIFALLPTTVADVSVDVLMGRSQELFDATRQLDPPGPPSEKKPRVVIFPVVATGTAPDDVRRWIGRHAPKHWMAEEFPVVVALEQGDLLMRTRTPMWGGAYAKGYRRMAEGLFSVN